VCDKRNELELSRYEFDEILTILKDNLKKYDLTLHEIVDLVDKPEPKVLKVIDWLTDNEKLIRNDSDKFQWHE
jgi:hypothetical protein